MPHVAFAVDQAKFCGPDPDAPKPQMYISLDISPDPEDHTIVAADDNNDVWEVDDSPRILVEGQSGDVCGLAVHPTRHDVYATACTDGHVCVWDADDRRNIKVLAYSCSPCGEPLRQL